MNSCKRAHLEAPLWTLVPPVAALCDGVPAVVAAAALHAVQVHGGQRAVGQVQVQGFAVRFLHHVSLGQGLHQRQRLRNRDGNRDTQ